MGNDNDGDHDDDGDDGYGEADQKLNRIPGKSKGFWKCKMSFGGKHIGKTKEAFCIFGIMTNFVACLYHNPSLICAPGVSCGGFGKF